MPYAAPTVEVDLKRVLVATDFSAASEKALRHAIAIARSYGAKFYLAHVVSALGFKLAGGDTAAMAADAAKEISCSWKANSRKRAHSPASSMRPWFPRATSGSNWSW